MFSTVNGDLAKKEHTEPKTGKSNGVILSHFLRKDSLRDEDMILRQNRFYSAQYEETFRQSLDDPETFWAKVGEEVVWTKRWDKVLDNSNPPFTKWFVGGELNACYNAVDRHVEAGHKDKVALIHASPVTNVTRRVTYGELQDQVSHLAGALAALGVTKGDRVLIYMPLIPETIVAMLATVRLGAIHSVVFGGFAARELCTRIEHAEPKVIIAASCGVEPHKIIKYKDIVDEAIASSAFKPKNCIIFQRRNVDEAELLPGIDLDWDDVVGRAKPHPCVSVEANWPLYILYTSGTTDKPKGILRPTGGHLATLCWSMRTVYGMRDGDVWWGASDMGWVVGHSYICYGPLLAGMTSVMYEGKPDRTPDAGQYFRVIQEHGVCALFTAPTTLRLIRRADPMVKLGGKYSTKSLRHVFVAGEHCDQETMQWAENVFKVPILNHWWQTETGHAITASCIGLGHSVKPPKYSAGMPMPGYDVGVLRSDGTEAAPQELGRIVVKLPMPPGTMSTLYKSEDRFKSVYFSRYPGYYDTMDAGFRDEYGYVYVTARDDDVINVSGHRLSTSALEDVVMTHPDVIDTAVIGVPEPTRGEVPLCLFVMRQGAQKKESEIGRELVSMIRELIGPIAAFRLSAAVRGLPRTRSGKTSRKSIADLARNKFVKIPGTIEDPSVYKEIKMVLQKLGYARTAPDPE